MKNALLKITALLILLLAVSGIRAQLQFGDIKCDSFKVTVDETEALIYQKNKTAVYNRTKNEFLIKPTKSSILFYPVDSYYLVVNKDDMMLYNFHCVDSLMPCIEKYAGDSCVLFNTVEHDRAYLQQDDRKHSLSQNYDGNPEWAYQPKKEKIKSNIRTIKKPSFTKEIGALRINDSLLLIQNYKCDYMDPNTYALKSLQYPGDDSLIYDPTTGFYNAIYPGPIPGYEYCGLYNLNNKRWIVAPTKHIYFYSSRGGVISDIFRVPDHNWIDSVRYSFMDIYGKFLFVNKRYVDIDYSPIIAATVTFADTAIAMPDYARNQPRNERFFQVFKDGRMAIVNPSNSIELISEYKDFVHYNVPNDFFFWLENDSIHADLNGREYAVNQTGGKIEVYCSNTFPSKNYLVYLIEGKDTIRKTVGDGIYLKPFNDRATVSLEIIDENLIINDYDQLSKASELTWKEYRADESLWSRKMAYQEESYPASSIWKKEAGTWVKKTPYCKAVEKLNFGYLLLYHSYFKEKSYSQKTYTLESFTFLDKNFNHMYFNGFSVFTKVEITEEWIELTTEHGSFFVDHQGQLIKNKN